MSFQAMHDPKTSLSWEDIEGMVRSCVLIRDRALIALMAFSGIRVTEAVTILVDNINWNERTITIRAEKKRGEVYRDIAVTTDLLSLLRQHLTTRQEPSPYLFPGQKLGTHLTRATAYNIVRDAAERIGLYQIGNPNISSHRAGREIHPGRHVGCHSLRHSLALLWIREVGGDGESIRKLQMQLGHASPATTLSYLTYSGTELHSLYDAVFRERKLS